MIRKASPSNKISWLGLAIDVRTLLNGPLSASVKTFLQATGSHSFYDRMLSVQREVGNLSGLSVKRDNLVDDSGAAPIGQLSFKKEAAGKLRVFAMVDIWTQSMMRPLHDSLFSILGKLPNDGTMDQEAAFARAQVKARENGCCYGYDLSAATDRLPIGVQKWILTSLSSRELADS